MAKPSKSGVLSLLFFALTHSALAAHHPGNVHVVGEDVVVRVPAAWTTWQAIDIDGKQVGAGTVRDQTAELGKLPIGYFELREKAGGEKVTAAVVAKASPAEDTPIAVDTAISWFYADPQQIRDACALSKLAGVRWVRDRASWPELETARGTWADDTRYERAMRIQHEEGLKILQVNHISPPWATSDPKRFPEDLRDVYNFCRGLAQRWNGLADAIEPWNEPDIDMFGGHTGCEIASFQKAAYLGMKAGHPQHPVSALCFAIDRAETLDEYGANEVYPYFDRYHLHHYIGLPAYPRAYARHRAVSGGRPIWVTEFNLPVSYSDEATKEPPDEELRKQAFRVGKVYAGSLHEGTEKAFYFILGDYVERQFQFGLLHHDLTPRPAYVAFAAVGRFLNAAEPIGRVDLGDELLKAYVFKTKVDGAEKETLVAWSETKETNVEIPTAEAAYDYLGRELPSGKRVNLTRETVFAVLPPGGSNALTVVPPPAKAPWRDGRACHVVLQLLGKADFKQSAYLTNESNELRLVAYNFGDKTAKGIFDIDGADAESREITLEPGERQERAIQASGEENVTVRLDLGDLGTTIVSARIMKTPLPESPQ